MLQRWAGPDIAGELLSEGQSLESLLASARSPAAHPLVCQALTQGFRYLQRSRVEYRPHRGLGYALARGVDELLREMVGNLNPEFMLWAVAETDRREQLDTADLLSRSLLTWMSSVSLLRLFRANVLLERAHRHAPRRRPTRGPRSDEVIAEDERFVGLPQIIEAQIMIAEVDRLSGRFEEAEGILADLMRSRDLKVRAPGPLPSSKNQKRTRRSPVSTPLARAGNDPRHLAGHGLSKKNCSWHCAIS